VVLTRRAAVTALATVVGAVVLPPACATNPKAPLAPPGRKLDGTDGRAHAITPEGAAYVVLIFFSPGCHVLALHDERIRQLATEYEPRGVKFFAVDAEVDADLERDRAEAARRRYPFPVLLDRGGELARSLGAEFAGYTVVLDGRGDVRFRGGIDSDRVHLRADRTPYLEDALSDLLAGRAPRLAESKSLGCALRLR
jgi:hypothetical protein